jgi:hypothetical protein
VLDPDLVEGSLEFRAPDVRVEERRPVVPLPVAGRRVAP